MMKTNDDELTKYKKNVSVLRSYGLNDCGTVRNFMRETPSVVKEIYDIFEDVCLFEMNEMETNPIRYIKNKQKIGRAHV